MREAGDIMGDGMQPDGMATRNGVLVVMVVAMFITAFMGSALNLSIPDISDDLSCGATTSTWIVNIFTLTTAALSVPLGHLGDTSERRRIFLAGTALFALTSLFCSLAPSVHWLIGMRALQGAASAMIMGVNIPILLAAAPPSQRGRMLGYSITALYLGLALGPVLGGLLNNTFGWRSIFFAATILPGITFALAWRFIPADDIAHRMPQDARGNTLFISMITCLLLGLSFWGDGWWAYALVGTGALLTVGFVVCELRSEKPALQVRLFAHDAGYTLSNVAAFLNYASTFAIGYSMSLYLQSVMGLPAALAGLVLVSQPLAQAAVSPFAGRLSDRVVPHRLASAGMAVIAIGLILLDRVSPTTPLPFIIGALVVAGIGFGFFSSPNTNAVLSCVDASHVGEANAVLGTMRTLGMSLSMVLVIYILDSQVGDVVFSQADPSALAAAIHTVLVVCTVMCLVGTVISLVRGRSQRKG